MHIQYLEKAVVITFCLLFISSLVIIYLCQDSLSIIEMAILPVWDFFVCSILAVWFDDSDDDSYGYGAFN